MRSRLWLLVTAACAVLISGCDRWSQPVSRVPMVRFTVHADTRSPSWPKTSEGRESVLVQAREVVLKRLAGMAGVAEPVVEIDGADRLLIDVPETAASSSEILRLVSSGTLEFYWLKNVQNANNRSAKWRIEAPTGSEQEFYLFTGPGGVEYDSVRQPNAVLERVVDSRHNKPILTGKDLLPTARANINSRSQIVVNIEFNARGAEVFRGFTRGHIGEYLAVFFDGKLLTAPVIIDAIPGGKAEITGFVTLTEARRMCDRLNSGTIPVPLKVVSQQKI